MQINKKFPLPSDGGPPQFGHALPVWGVAAFGETGGMNVSTWIFYARFPEHWSWARDFPSNVHQRSIESVGFTSMHLLTVMSA
jgi:hypothetical protein